MKVSDQKRENRKSADIFLYLDIKKKIFSIFFISRLHSECYS